ncbi:MAG: methyltransferase domain-containing protein [Acidobacteria bacterium]|nr:methyltransferase domain-containing protein [Acidobacteriota bacterium]
MTDSTWSEADSEVYRRLAQVAVPEREGLMATLLALVPFGEGEAFRAVELGSGEGYLSRALKEAFPTVEVLALDGSSSMRQATAARLAPCGERGRVGSFELAEAEWRSQLSGSHLVFSSLCIHHLDEAGKQQLLADVFAALEPGGALLFIDLVEPASSRGRELFAEQWDESTQRRSREKLGDDRAFGDFLRERWNHYRFPDPVDQPSSLPELLNSLRHCGFEGADCFLLVAGHAVVGGYKPQAGSGAPSLTGHRISLARARQAVASALA